MPRKIRPEVQKGLNICVKIAHILKEKYPNEIFALKKNSIIPFTTIKRLCDTTSMDGYSHYHNSKPHRICCKQKFLVSGHNWHSQYEFGRQKKGTGYHVTGTLGYILLMAHELAHHRTHAHGSNWYAKCNKFQDFMINQVISGEYYK